MIANPDEFQSIVLQKGNKSKSKYNKLSIDNITINITKSVELLGVTIEKKLNFEEHISVLCNL